MESLLSLRELCPEIDWCILRVETGRELRVSERLQQRAVEQFLPTYQERRRFSHRAAEIIQRVYFPGYIFARFPFEERTLVLQTPGVYDLLRFGMHAATLTDTEIQSVRLMVDSGPCEITQIAKGQTVEICEGALQGCRGIVVKLKNSQRVLLSINIDAIGRAISRPWTSEIDPERLRVIQKAA